MSNDVRLFRRGRLWPQCARRPVVRAELVLAAHRPGPAVRKSVNVGYLACGGCRVLGEPPAARQGKWLAPRRFKEFSRPRLNFTAPHLFFRCYRKPVCCLHIVVELLRDETTKLDKIEKQF